MKKNEDFRGVNIGGQTYLTQTQASLMAGVTILTLKKKLKVRAIKPLTLQSSRNVFYLKSEIEKAVEDGVFNWGV